MAFYATLSRYYDRLFPLDQENSGFLASEPSGRKRILDAACGTGTYARFLADNVHTVVGIDADAAMLHALRSGRLSQAAFSAGFAEFAASMW